MASSASISTLTEALVATVAKLNHKNSACFKSLKRRAEDTLKSNSYPRTDQFAVAHQLEGLQEKFQVLNRDELADALRTRLTELDAHRSSWFPEILSLFLQLSDRPAQRSKLEKIEKLQPKELPKSLCWSELDGAGAAYCDEEIWETVDFGAGSSDDDFSSISSDSLDSRAAPDTLIESDEDYVIPDDVFSSVETEEDLIAPIESAQFWREENNPDPKDQGVASRVITELQVVRETIFLLQGLPTSLFRRLDDGGVVVDRRYALAHLSNKALSSILGSLSGAATKIDVLRRFIKTPTGPTRDIAPSVPYVRTFHRGIEECLNEFDKFMSSLQLRYLTEGCKAPVSLLQLSDDVRCESRLLSLLADLILKLQAQTTGSSVRCLDLLYDSVCMTQATGDDNEFMYLARLFFRCFETYARPIRAWMETGHLEDSDAFFILEICNDNDLRTLWTGWYTLDEASRLLNAPKFIRPAARKIFITGKSRVFLRQLDATEDPEHCRKISLTFEDVFPEDLSSVCLPFSALLESAFGRIVDESHSVASSLLHKALDQQCGLWVSLECLEHIYFCKDMSVSGPIDEKIFDLIDRKRAAWSDRFLLTEIAQSAFSVLDFVDSSRVIVRSSNDKLPKPGSQRSVSMLHAISLDYTLPWPVANIITKDSIARYQRVSVFLMQIRRAKHMIVKQHLQYSDPADRTLDNQSNASSYAIRHNMLWFLNTLYSHMTDFVISTTSASLRKSLSDANDVDSMILAHRAYMSSLEDQCLLSKNLYPLHRATITLLDLCISFADLQAMRHGRHRPDASKILYTHANSQINTHRPGADMSDEDEDEDGDDDSDDSDAEDVNHSSTLHETHYVDRLSDIRNQFNRLVAFMVAGLKGVGRVDGQLSWEILADRLEWRK